MALGLEKEGKVIDIDEMGRKDEEDGQSRSELGTKRIENQSKNWGVHSHLTCVRLKSMRTGNRASSPR